MSVATAQPGGHWLTGYYATYNNGVMSPSQVDYTKLTDVIYWPVIPNPDGSLNETPFGLSQSTFDGGATAMVAGAHAAGAKALIGFGGNSESGASAGFSGATKPANLAAFVNNIVALMQKFGFDGVDINWEDISASSSADNAQFTAFIGALRTKLNTITPTPLLTMPPAVTFGQAGTVTTQQLIASVYQDFDQLNIQTYVMSGPYCGWETWYNSPLSNGGLDFLLVPGEALPSANGLIASFAAAGIRMSKMAIGIQFDAAVWQGGTGTSTGGVTKPHQTWTNDASICSTTNPAAPSWTTIPYRQMVALETTAGYTQNFDSTADQNWLGFDPSGTGTTNESKDQFISYDSPQSIAKKGQDLVAQQATTGVLGGAFLFELSGDYAPTAAAGQQHPLLAAMFQMRSLLPGAVSGLTATPAATSATLNWNAAAGAASYKVFFETSQGSGPGAVAASVNSTTAAVLNLTPGKQYWFLLAGVDAFGTGPTAETSVTIPSDPHAPMGLIATAGVNQVQLSWTAVTGAASYTIIRSPDFTGAATRSATAAKYTDSPLTASKVYSYQVASVGGWGSSAESNHVSATPFGPLTAATGLKAVVSPGKVVLTWSAVPHAATYHVKRSTVSGTGYTYVVTATATTPTVTDAESFSGTTTYYYVVQAFNGTAYGPVSAQVSAKPPPPLPHAPGTPAAVAGLNQVALTWAAVSNSTSYPVLRSSTSGSGYAQVGSSTTASYTDKTVVGGYTYYYVVRASNASGQSGNSPQVSAKPSLPAPAGLAASVVGAIVDLNWNAVSGALGYRVLRGTVNEGPYPTIVGTAANGTALEDDSAVPGTKYYYVVEAYTIPVAGKPSIYSLYSRQVTATVPIPKPPAPTGLQAFLSQQGNGVFLTWNKSTGAASYNVLRSATSGAGYKQVGTSPAPLYTDGPIAAGTYYYVVEAVNTGVSSGYSNQASFTVPPAKIPVPPDFSPVVQNGMVSVNNIGSTGATTYGYYKSSAEAGPYSLLLQADQFTYTDTNVVAGSTYYYEMTAGNSAGTSAFTAPQSATIPVVPTGLNAAPGNGQVSLTWNAVPGASSYWVAGGTSVATLGTIFANTATNSYTAKALTNGTPYYFEVQTVGPDTTSTGAYTAPVSATPSATQPTVWIPDFDGQLLQVRIGSGASATAITVNLPTCNPNSVAVNQNKAYVVCSANGANPDKILVYNATTIRAAPAGTLAISPLQTIASADFNSLIGIAFDASNDLWVASNGNNEVLEFTAAQLASATPKDTVSLIDSPGSPVALAFDTDGSLWVTGLFGDGILLNFTKDQFGLGENANPRYCAVTDPQGGICISQANLFLEPEGVAVFNGGVWVANNSTTGSNGLGGATPGRELVNLLVSGGLLTVKGTYGKVLPDTGGGTATSPFFCPGGLFATPSHLWLNDESYGEATPQCGANGDSASKTGAVFSFTPAQLMAEPATQAPAFPNVTGRPGFGGIFIEFD